MIIPTWCPKVCKLRKLPSSGLLNAFKAPGSGLSRRSSCSFKRLRPDAKHGKTGNHLGISLGNMIETLWECWKIDETHPEMIPKELEGRKAETKVWNPIPLIPNTHCMVPNTWFHPLMPYIHHGLWEGLMAMNGKRLMLTQDCANKFPIEEIQIVRIFAGIWDNPPKFIAGSCQSGVGTGCGHVVLHTNVLRCAPVLQYARWSMHTGKSKKIWRPPSL